MAESNVTTPEQDAVPVDLSSSFRSILKERRSWAIFLTCWCIYLFYIGPVPGVNENRYLDLTRSMVDEGRFAIDTFHYNTVDKSYREGHYYAGAAPGPALLAIPPYLLYKMLILIRPVTLFSQYDVAHYIRDEMGMPTAPDAFVSRYPFSEFVLMHILITSFVCSMLTACIVVLLYRMLGWLGVTETHRLLILGFYAFGTLTFFYATRLYAHMPSTFFTLFGFGLLWAIRTRRLPSVWAKVAGFSLGMAIFMEYTVLPIVVTVGVYGLITLKRSDVISYLVGGLIPIFFLCLYHYFCFGNPFRTAYSFLISLEDSGPNGVVLRSSTLEFGLPSGTALWGLSFSTYRGIFVYMPVLLFAVYGLVHDLFNRTTPYRLEWGVMAVACALQFLFNSAGIKLWEAGYVWGARYMVPMLPFLMVPLGRAFSLVPRPLMIAVGSLSILINWTAVQYILPQHAFGGVAMFLLSGPSSQLYQFLKMYISTYTEWNVTISILGAWIMLIIVLWGIWRIIDARPLPPATSSSPPYKTASDMK